MSANQRIQPFLGRRAGSGYEPEYLAVLARATTLGYTKPPSGQNVINNEIIKQLKIIGVWQKLDLFYFFRQPSGLGDFCRLNWVDPSSFELTSTSGQEPNFIADSGFQGTSGPKYFKTGYTPLTSRINFDINNASIFWKAFGIPSTFAGTSILAGTREGTGIDQLLIGDGNNTTSIMRFTTNNSTVTAQGNENKHRQLVRYTAYLPTVDIYEESATPTYGQASAIVHNNSSLSDKELYLLSLNDNGTTLSTTQTCGLEYFALGANPSIAGPEALNIYNILNP